MVLVELHDICKQILKQMVMKKLFAILGAALSGIITNAQEQNQELEKAATETTVEVIIDAPN